MSDFISNITCGTVYTDKSFILLLISQRLIIVRHILCIYKSGDLIICNERNVCIRQIYEHIFFYFIINCLSAANVAVTNACKGNWTDKKKISTLLIQISDIDLWLHVQYIHSIYTIVFIQINNNNLKTSQLNNWTIFLQNWWSIADCMWVYNKMSGKIRALRSSIKVKTIYYTDRTYIVYL